MSNSHGKVIGVIPARLNSVRFPSKILAPFNGHPMVMSVAERALQANTLDEVIIAVDCEDVKKKLANSSFKIVMTSMKHCSGSDRVAEVIKDKEADIVVNIQGDEPMLDPVIIDSMVNIFCDDEVQMSTCVSTDISLKDYADSNTVKVLLDEQNNANLFQRSMEKTNIEGWYRHVGVYAYRKQTLLDFASLPPSYNEKKLFLEQLRALDNGISVRAVITDYPYRGVDTKEDLERLNHMCVAEDL